MSTVLTHHVCKAFDDDGVQRLPGECVNALPWRTAPQLETQRYIQKLPDGIEPVADNEGRYWLSAEWLTRHGRTPLDTGASEVSELPEVKKLPGVGLWELPGGAVFRGSKQKAREAAAQLAGA